MPGLRRQAVTRSETDSRIGLFRAVEVRRFSLAHAWTDIRAILLGLLVVLPLAAADGGYFPPSWGWGALALLWCAALCLLFREFARLGVLERTLLVALCGLSAWIYATTAWAESASTTVREFERALLYLSAVLAAMLITRSRSYHALLAGVLAAVTLVSIYSLATRLFPDRFGSADAFGGYRLSEPLGYWNGLGILVAIGAVLALGFAARSANTAVRVLAGASTVMLVATLYFTFSRGAWIALAVGLLAAILLDPRRLNLAAVLLVIAPWCALAVWLASRSEPLTQQGSLLDAAARDGHRLTLALLGLSIAAGAAAAILAYAERRARIPHSVRRGFAGILLVALVASLGVVAARYGGPADAIAKARDSFAAPPPTTEGDLNRRLFSLSSTGRSEQWDVAWRALKDEPLLGFGGGSYERLWLQNRAIAFDARDAHNLYLETGAELGVIGLALLAVVLGAPLIAAVRARRRRLVPVAFGAYVAFLVHAAVDWDWELPAVTLSALFCGVAILAAVRPQGLKPLSARVRVATLLVVLGLSAFALVGLVGSSAIARSDEALAARDWDTAESEARKATRWAPWSAESWSLLAQAQTARGDFPAARASFRRGIAKDPGNWELWFGLALVSDGQEQLEALTRATDLNPRDPEASFLRQALAATEPGS